MIMRLDELAIELSVNPSEIVSFLAARGQKIEEVSDFYLEGDVKKTVIDHFSCPQNTQSSTTAVFMQKKTDIPQHEVIKAPKVRLPGLTVVGKVDIQNTKDKNIKQNELRVPKEDRASQLPSTPTPINPSRENFAKLNFLTSVKPQRSKKESKKYETKKHAEEQWKKKRRTDSYLAKMKRPAVHKNSLKKKKDAYSEVLVEKPKPQRPTNWLTGIFSWFVTR